jgi:hypothetical protein
MNLKTPQNKNKKSILESHVQRPQMKKIRKHTIVTIEKY